MIENITIDKYTWKASGLYKTVKKKDDEFLEKLCPNITISKRFLDPLSGDESLEITNGEVVVKEHASILNLRNIQKLVEKGFTLNPLKMSDISYALQLMRDTLPKVIEYPSVGCIVTETDDQFILLEDTFTPDNFQGVKPITSSKINIKAKGTLADWIKMFQNEVLGTPQLELATAVGISGLINSYLFNNGITQINSLFFHFVGDSSSGKTTSAMLALSTSGSPDKGQHGLLKSWLATQNGIVQSLNDNFGVPFAFDELSMSEITKMTPLIYSITEGSEKARLNQDGSPKPVRRWNTVIISTGEFSLLQNQHTAKNNGLNVRVIELNGKWTKSATNSDNIKKVVQSNYGHILKEIADLLGCNDIKDIENHFNKHKKWFLNALQKDTSNTGTRMVDSYAVIMLSVEYLELVLADEIPGLKLKTNDIRQIFIDYHWDTVTNRSMEEKAIDAIVQFVAKNRSKFSTGKKLTAHTDNYGLINLVSPGKSNTQSFIQVNILKDAFSILIGEANFQDSKIVIKALKDAGYLIINEKDRLYNRTRITDDDGQINIVPFYTIKIDKSYAELLGLETQNNGNTNQPKVSDKEANVTNDCTNNINKPSNKYVNADLFEGL
ncbi:DUF927 domain-containing protein [Macrococcoides bohemicum]|uniref:DUF927 domain-containing protein n=1 Tax=Macrococcoides bohemicum TaxID=1903056 RepID=UPI00105A3058|nr:DUF927 domain-containing protein [Macrococcus bohemicus]TDL38271.1 DUF927 domain-containing protein [Macrococcus bohemicus]